MRLITRTVGRVGAQTGLALLALAAPQAAHSDPIPSPSNAAPGASQADLLLFKRAMTEVWSRPALQSDSDLKITISGQGAATTYRENIQLVATHEGQYRSQVTLIHPDGDRGVVYQVVCDGHHVGTYRPGLRRYALQSRHAFEAADSDFPFLGLYTGAIFLADPSFKVLFDSITPSNGPEILRTLSSIGMRINSHSETLGGATYTVFNLSTGPDSYLYRFFVNPKTADIGQIEMSVTRTGVKMGITERIQSAKTVATHPGDFALAPPAGTERVSELPVSPFYDLSP